MAEAWVMRTEVVNPKEENRLVGLNVPVTYEDLAELGVYHRKVSFGDPEQPAGFADEEARQAYINTTLIPGLLKSHRYSSFDRVNICREAMPEFDAKLKVFFTTHIHEDEEIRLVESGSGYFDILRRKAVATDAAHGPANFTRYVVAGGEEWVRIKVAAGDMIVISAGVYHRFTVDTNESIQAIRLFKDNPKWIPINKPEADTNATYLSYVDSINPERRTTVVGGVSLALQNAIEHGSSPAEAAAALSTGVHSFLVTQPAAFDRTVSFVTHHVLRAAGSAVLILYFTGSRVPQTQQSWCPDCVEAEEHVQSIVSQLSRRREQLILIQCDVLRSSYIGNPAYPFRTHPAIKLASVPTLWLLEAGAANPPRDSLPHPLAGLHVLLHTESIDGNWVENHLP